MAKHLTDADFTESTKKGVALVDFHATWCGPCKMIAPIIEQLSKKYDGKAVVGKVDIDQAEKVAEAFGISSVPTVILLVDGKEVKRVVGVNDFDFYDKLLASAL